MVPNMVHQTSWDGVQTKRFRRRGMRGGYTRYVSRDTRQGLQVVKNKKFYNKVYTTDGRFIGIEPKYKNYATDDSRARKIYEQKIRRRIPKQFRKKVI